MSLFDSTRVSPLPDKCAYVGGIESSDGLACCPSECGVCETGCKSDKHPSYTWGTSGSHDYGSGSDSSSDSGDSGWWGKRRLTIKDSASGDSSDSGDYTNNGCGVKRRRRLTWSSSDSSDSGDGSGDYCDCGPGYVGGDSSDSGDRRRRGLTWGSESKDSSDDGCDCGNGRRLTYDKYDSSSSDDCDCNCECECECVPEEVPEPEPSCCADDIVVDGERCDVVGTAPCFLGMHASTT